MQSLALQPEQGSNSNFGRIPPPYALSPSCADYGVPTMVCWTSVLHAMLVLLGAARSGESAVEALLMYFEHRADTRDVCSTNMVVKCTVLCR